MCQFHPWGRFRELSLIVVREAPPTLPYEFTLDMSAEFPRHGRDKHEVV